MHNELPDRYFQLEGSLNAVFSMGGKVFKKYIEIRSSLGVLSEDFNEQATGREIK